MIQRLHSATDQPRPFASSSNSIDYFGYGVDLKTERPTPEKIANGVIRILGDERFAQNVERICAELNTYSPLELIDGSLTAGDEIEAPSLRASRTYQTAVRLGATRRSGPRSISYFGDCIRTS